MWSGGSIQVRKNAHQLFIFLLTRFCQQHLLTQLNGRHPDTCADVFPSIIWDLCRSTGAFPHPLYLPRKIVACWRTNDWFRIYLRVYIKCWWNTHVLSRYRLCCSHLQIQNSLKSLNLFSWLLSTLLTENTQRWLLLHSEFTSSRSPDLRLTLITFYM